MTTRPPTSATLPVPGTEIALGQGPLTVAEYAAFYEDDAYASRAHWSSAGFGWRAARSITQPRGWGAQRESVELPVVGLSWWEAEAYCNWLSTRTSGTWRLPTEVEWLIAAGGDPAAFPWGAAPPTRAHANFDRRIGGPSIAGAHGLGSGPFGHHDLAGNVWEWCADDLGLDEAGEPLRAWRGASWARPAENLRAGVRHVARARARGGYLGCRIARVIHG